MTPLQQELSRQLSGSRFRALNESLYTQTSSASKSMFEGNEKLFDDYHAGFRKQTESWTVNPVDGVIKWLKSKRSENISSVAHTEEYVVGDFGCGEAKVAKTLTGYGGAGARPAAAKAAAAAASPPLRGGGFVVHSFDLIATSGMKDIITPCDIAKTPLKNGVLDAAVYCLSLVS